MAHKKFYITTTLPYVNSDPHLGFALEIIQADVIARYKRLAGYDVFFNTGTDEHGIKIYKKAVESGYEPKEYVDEYAAKFDRLKATLNLSYNNFIRTTDLKHTKAAQAFWKKCMDNGDIYKAEYEVKYCVGCELEKTESELVDGRCVLHPTLNLETYQEENYYFRFSKYEKQLLKLYENNASFVIPQHRLTEVKNFVAGGLKDFSISRLKEKLPWGVPVPDDPDHTMYVWFDALVNYVSAIGWPDNKNEFTNWWPVVQLAGKDNLRQQASMWQAMLFSAGLPPSERVIIHGFIGSGGQRMSKTLGNVVDPVALSEKYGADSVRYYLLAKMDPFEDSDFTVEKFENVYNGDLANGLGNLVSRVAKLCENGKHDFPESEQKLSEAISEKLESYKYNEAIEIIWSQIRELDIMLANKKPWEMKGDEQMEILKAAVKGIRRIAYNLHPFMPATSTAIADQFRGPAIKSKPPLFPRL